MYQIKTNEQIILMRTEPTILILNSIREVLRPLVGGSNEIKITIKTFKRVTLIKIRIQGWRKSKLIYKKLD